MKASLCVGNYAQTPYCIEGIDIEVYSMEELCYCIKENVFLLDVSLMNDELLQWIDRECGLLDLVRELNPMVHKVGSLSAFVTKILEYTGFYPAETIREIEQILKQGAGLSLIEKQKNQMDQLVKKKKYSAAIRGYDSLLAKWQTQECPDSGVQLPAADVKAGIYYNRGVVYTKLFLYRQAAGDFRAAWQLDGQERYLTAYLAAMRMEITDSEYVALVAEIPESYKVSMELEKRLETLKLDWRGTLEYKRMEPGYAECLVDDKILQSLKKSYRSSAAD